jgi:hypothetical protein
LLALLSLVAALLGPALPGYAAATPAEPGAVHAAMGCDKGTADTHRKAPAHHVPGAMDCCVANTCAMTLALPAVPSAVAIPAAPKAASYSLRAAVEPADIDSAPIPHPPKAA